MSFKNKTVVITGGASGLGYLCGENFAKEGANIVLVDINQKGLDDAKEKISAFTNNIVTVCADITDYDQVAGAKDVTVKEFGSFDILINCAGGAEARLLNDYTEFKDRDISVFDFGIDLNLKSAVYFAQNALKQMAEQKSGVIIFLGSITGEEGCKTNIAYSAAKSALMNGVTKSLALYGAKYNVRVCCISPGPVLTRKAMASMKTLMKRAAQPQEIVDLIMYTASDKASFITGTNYLIDGGRNIMRNKE